MAKPDKIDQIWADTGVIVDPGDAKWSLGWIAEIPPYQWLNYMFNKITTMLSHINTHGIPEWDELTDYALGAKVLYLGIEYKCILAGASLSTPDLLINWVSTDSNQSTKTTDSVIFNTVTAEALETPEISVDSISEKTIGGGITFNDSIYDKNGNEVLAQMVEYKEVTTAVIAFKGYTTKSITFSSNVLGFASVNVGSQFYQNELPDMVLQDITISGATVAFTVSNPGSQSTAKIMCTAFVEG